MSTPTVHDTDRVRWVSFNRPEKLNALTRDDIRSVTRAVQDLPADVRCLVFTGSGSRAFSAGVHVDTFDGLTPEDARQFISELGAMIAAARRAPVPTLCAIQGYCLGGAMELAMACDLRVASTDAVFGMPEIKVGIPSVIDAALLQQHLGLAKAKELLLTGDLYGVAELAPLGFVNKVVEPAALTEAATELAARVTGHSPAAIAAQKRLFETWQNASLEDSIKASIVEFALVFADPGTQQRIASYRSGTS
ncbi:MAG: enoyl-CoA hydratase [Propionibacteriales bacterium]|nr:enoyl-CoA hydratase [Propionibacteriales bacterium]